MKVLIFSTFLFSVFLLSACSYLQNLDYNREIEHAIVDNGDVLCEYIKGVRINCYKKSNLEEIENEKI